MTTEEITNFTRLRFLIAHHVGEDRFLFPFMAEASGDASITQQESEEHQRLEKTINFIKTKLKNIDSNADNKTTEEAVAEIQSKFREIVEVLVGESGHLKREETKFTAQNMRSWGISEKKLREVNSQLHAIIPDYLDKMEGLIFIIYHLNDEEKLFWDERIPCIVTKFKFPSKANQRKSMWSLAPYCRNNGREESKAKCTWHQG